MIFDARIDPKVDDWCKRVIPDGSTPAAFMHNFVRESGLLAVASLAFPDLSGDLASGLTRRFSISEHFASSEIRSAMSDDLAAEFIALCWRYWATSSMPGRGICVTIVHEPGPTVVMTETAEEDPTLAWIHRLPPFYRWEIPDFDPIRFYPTLAPEFRKWRTNNDPSKTVADYLREVVTVSGIAAVAQTAFPELIEVNGHILIKDQYDEKIFNDWLPSLAGDRGAAERTVNHFVVWDDLYGSEHDDAADEQAAEFIAMCWRYWFHDQYPDRRFQVSIIDQYGPTVTVFEIRD